MFKQRNTKLSKKVDTYNLCAILEIADYFSQRASHLLCSVLQLHDLYERREYPPSSAMSILEQVWDAS